MFQYNFTELTRALCDKYNGYPSAQCSTAHIDPNVLGQIDVFIEQFQECSTSEQFQQCLQVHMFDAPWARLIFPYFKEYIDSGSNDLVKIVLDDGTVVECNVHI